MKEFTKCLSETVVSRIAVMETRLTAIEDKLSSMCTSAVGAGSSVPEVSSIADIVSKTLVELDSQREVTKMKSLNVIVSGFATQPDQPDIEAFESFCQDNLTVKPKIVRARRLGRTTEGNQPAKLCLTLESSDSVNSLIQSASILRQNRHYSRVFINRDLTKAQADEAYKARCRKRATQPLSHQPSAAATSSQPFSVAS